ncbi:selenocysteine lyase isoform X3 [Lagenorhynchus albirostris]|uniref:selenocysteine lyase isoform X3 n=1 Tax=Lagenorhynchus albirostris TaxID=27610 RepID=UPI0028E612B6|nr:selenocysteine lyase isoform X3 [Lagenorhynchus albirostris]XP_060007683.1 selenocysteine lyase isoform X3 [Lagenorhynchus albirostris]XP_060007684.1 selenocysteine lyase isoform X3 [Lagenorhynchus albirostris]
MCGSLGLQGSPASLRRKVGVSRKVYMDYNATTPLEPEVIQAMTEAMQEAWGNPSSPYAAGRKAKEIINAARENLAKMMGGRPQDMIFTSGGTEVEAAHGRGPGTFVAFTVGWLSFDLRCAAPEGPPFRTRSRCVFCEGVTWGFKGPSIFRGTHAAFHPGRLLPFIWFAASQTWSNNLVIHSVVKHFHKIHAAVGDTAERPSPVEGALPHIITCTVEHDSIRLPLEHLVEEQVAEVTFVPVSKVNGQVEAEDILAAVRPATCLVTIMLANNETGVIMPVPEISRRVRALNQQRAAGGLPGVLVHTDAAQALGKRRVDVRDLGVDFLTVVGHKFYGPRIGALYVRGLGELTPLYPMLFGGGQERNFRPGTENTPMIAGLGKAAELVAEKCEAYEAHMQAVRDYLEERLAAEFGERVHLNSQFPGTERLPNTCNFSIQGPRLQGRLVLAQCRTLLASLGAACHSDHGDRPSPVLLSCGVPLDLARNAIRLSVGRGTTQAEVDLVVQDLKQAVARLEGQA